MAIKDHIFSQMSLAVVHIDETLMLSYYANSIVNPLIYAITMQEFRKAVKQLCKRTAPTRGVQPTELHAIDLFGLIRHILVTWSEMGKQTRSSIGRHIECHVSVPQIARMVHYCRYLTVITIQQMSGYLFINFRMIPSSKR